MSGRTYRYFDGAPLFPFGHGLSYTTFAYGDLELPLTVRTGEDITVSVTVENTGPLAGEEVVQLYLTDLEASATVPIHSLQGFRRVYLDIGEKKTVTFSITARQMSLIDDSFRRAIEPGWFEVSVGGKQPGFGGVANATTTAVISGRFKLVGEVLPLGER
jgi:beta-glucosidase